MKRFEFLDHTADVAVKIYGGSLKELFISAALAMFSCLVEKKKNRPKAVLEEVAIRLEEEIIEDLFKNWLDELLFFHTVKGFVLARVKSLEFEEHFLLHRKVYPHGHKYNTFLSPPAPINRSKTAGAENLLLLSPKVIFLKACVLFDTFDNSYYQKKSEIKAVTYHELKVEKTRNGWRAQVIFDV